MATPSGSRRRRAGGTSARPWLLCLAAVLLAGAAAPAAAQDPEEKPGLLELTADSFGPKLRELPDDRWVLMEFYAHWCPACQRFQPVYEKVAAQLAARGDAEPVVTVARLDCANFGTVCDTFKIHGFPTMKLGTAADLAGEALDHLADVSPSSRSVGGVVAFLEQHLDAKLDGGSKAAAATEGAAVAATASKGAATAAAAAFGGRKGGAGLDKGGAAGGAGSAAAGRGTGVGGAFGPRADLHDVEGATITSWRFLASTPLLLKGPEARQALKDWVDLLAEGHPVERCQRGAERVRKALDTHWPDDADEPSQSLEGLQICPGSDFKEWSGCRGSTPDSGRGYTCGLWQLLHVLAARLPDTDNAGAVWLAAVKGFVKTYFQCTECAKHFVAHANKEEALGVARKRDAVLWAWRTHNVVNKRLGAEEAADPGKGDPGFRHIQFPPPQLCSKCRRDGGSSDDGSTIAWDEDEVYALLTAFYGSVDAAPRGLRARRSSWGDAGVVVALVGACLYALLRRSGQYALRKASSRHTM